MNDRCEPEAGRPGSESRRIFAEEQCHVAPGLQRIALLSQLTLTSGSGATVNDADGNRYVDFFAGVAVASLGHSHPRWVAAMEAQIRTLAVGSFTTKNRLEFLKRLAEVTPRGLRRAQLYSGGAEGVEAAIRLAKSYTGKYEVVGFWGGFHGKTAGVMGLIGDSSKHGWGPLPGGRFLTPYADCYRCPLKLEYPSCGLACAELARETVKRSTSGAVAAFLIEPMQGTAGNVIPPPEFLPAIREIAHEAGALLIADEMITGCGRTGTMFAVEHTGTIPDVMTLGKGMASGFPVAAVVSTDEIVQAEPFSKPSASSSSYGGNPLAAAAALATLETILDEGLVERSRALGAEMLARLKAMQERHEMIGDVRGSGLLIGLDLVKDRKTKEPIDRETNEWIFLECLRRGLLLMGYQPRVRINPPLTITREEMNEGLDVLDEVLAEAVQGGGSR
ncbi:MAG: 4-aminobutyrate aminotransferase / (S)-3-amino-2-methylpropionate transaminase / 5-aminovalerate [Candidatus Binatota bacterium]|nr:4-aminobutyrate aminotransferase / (S)-3-amino-2-methylpropionate transaminase / 5-aminovalerate [Candidatus Binatota bacterium]